MTGTKEQPDAVAQARRDVEVCRMYDRSFVQALDALIAAVRAECAADTKRLDWLASVWYEGFPQPLYDWNDEQGPLRAAIDAAMEAQP